MNDCHDCRYSLHGEKSPYCRCLLEYNKATAKEKVMNGLIGNCTDHKPFAAQADDVYQPCWNSEP